jgi:hypothetical protein
LFTDGVGASKDSHASGEFHSDVAVQARWIAADSNVVEVCARMAASGGVMRRDD